MPFGGEEEEEKEEEKVLCARFKVLFYIEIYGILTYLHIHKCGTLVTTAEFFANKTSLFFSRLSLVCFCRIIIEGKKKVPFLLSFFCVNLFPKSKSFLLFHDFTEYYY